MLATVLLRLVLLAPAEGAPTIDIWDESTWVDLTPEQKDQLRAKRARMRAAGEEPPPKPETVDEPADTEPEPEPIEPQMAEPHPTAAAPAYVEPARPPVLVRDPKLEEYWETKHRTLVATTTTFAILWGVGMVTAIGVGDLVRRHPTPARARATVAMSVFAAIGVIGTAISASMQGSHNIAKPLYFRSDGLALRF